MKGFKSTLFCLAFITSGTLDALVEYGSEPPSLSPKKLPKSTIKRRLRLPLSSSFKANFSLGTEGVQTQRRQNFWLLESSVQTPWDFFVKTHYRKAEGEGAVGGSGGLLVGFNWLRFGATENRVGVDIFGGLTWGQKGSPLATSRQDKMFGLRTHKTLHNVTMEMGFRHHLTGAPEEGELSIGNIQIFSMELGWKAGQDIFLLLGGGVVGVSPEESGLQKKIDWEYLSPELRLRLSSLVGVTVRADLRVKETVPSEAIQARLWNFPAACGNSLKASLSLTL